MTENSTGKSRFIGGLTRLTLANLVLIASAYVLSNFLVEDDGRALAYTLLFSSVLWVALPIGIASYYSSANGAPKVASGSGVRVGMWVSIAIGLCSCGDILLSPDASVFHSLISWELSAAALSIAAACLVVERGNPLPFGIRYRRRAGSRILDRSD